MSEQIAALILAWHMVHVDLGKAIESARIVLDQSDRGTLLPDRVREMRGEMITVQESIPALADLLEELTGEQSWPMKVEEIGSETEPGEGDEDYDINAPGSEPEGEPPPTSDEAPDIDGADGVARPASVDEEAAAEVSDEVATNSSEADPETTA